MNKLSCIRTLLAVVIALAVTSPASAAYWNVVNVQGESSTDAKIIVYGSSVDALDELGGSTHTLSGSPAVVDADSDGTTYWLLLNPEGDTTFHALYQTYGSLGDMLTSTNMLNIYTPDFQGAGNNVVGSGSDGTSYWNLFNAENETSSNAAFATYATLADMLQDRNRTSFHTTIFGNLVDTGFGDGIYWILLNTEGEASEGSFFITYDTLADMLEDNDRTHVFTNLAATGFVGTGSDDMQTAPPVPLPAGVWLLLSGGSALVALARRRRLVTSQ